MVTEAKHTLTCKELCKRVARSKPPHTACFPEVTHLTVEAIHDPIDSMPDLHDVLPNLHQLTVTTRGPLSKQHVVVYADDVQRCVQHCCDALGDCENVRVLQLVLTDEEGWMGSEVVLENCSYLDGLPPSLDDLRCDVRMEGLLEATEFVSRVRALTVVAGEECCLCDTLPELLRLAPLLQEFTVSDSFEMELMWGNDADPEDARAKVSVAEVCEIKRRLLGGFQLRCEGVTLAGPIEQVHALMSWLSPLLDTTHCSIDFAGTVVNPMCLDQVARVCPALTSLSLADSSSKARAAELEAAGKTDVGVLMPLVGMWQLDTLIIGMTLEFTNTSLVNLCGCLPALSSLHCPPCDSVCCATVMQQLAARGRRVKIN
ncbi:MAG: hypothetical protein WDW38_010634 [Sanguina aurantia]